jgi:hypothetical protein
MEGPYEGSRRRSYREVRIAGCRHRTSRPVEPTDTDPCGEDRGDNRPERSPMGIQRAARPSSSSKESGELESIENERVGLQFDLKENKAVPCRGDWLKRTSATTFTPNARTRFGYAASPRRAFKRPEISTITPFALAGSRNTVTVSTRSCITSQSCLLL